MLLSRSFNMSGRLHGLVATTLCHLYSMSMQNRRGLHCDYTMACEFAWIFVQVTYMWHLVTTWRLLFCSWIQWTAAWEGTGRTWFAPNTSWRITTVWHQAQFAQHLMEFWTGTIGTFRLNPQAVSSLSSLWWIGGNPILHSIWSIWSRSLVLVKQTVRRYLIHAHIIHECVCECVFVYIDYIFHCINVYIYTYHYISIKTLSAFWILTNWDGE